MKYTAEICNVVARNMRERRTELGYSQEKLAGISGISPLTIWKIENMEQWPGPDTVTSLSRALDIRPYELFLDHYSDSVVPVQNVEKTKSLIISAVQKELDNALPLPSAEPTDVSYQILHSPKEEK